MRSLPLFNGDSLNPILTFLGCAALLLSALLALAAIKLLKENNWSSKIVGLVLIESAGLCVAGACVLFSAV